MNQRSPPHLYELFWVLPSIAIPVGMIAVLPRIGGAILFLSALLYFLNIVLTMVASRQPAPAMPGFAEAVSGPDQAPPILDRGLVWIAVSAAMILFAYGPALYHLLTTTPFDSPGLRVW